MIILGLNAFHADSAAAILLDGKLVAAAEEERFRREKHWAGFPSQAIAYCLDEAGVDLGDIDHVALNQDGNAHLWRKAAYVLTKRPDPRFVLERLRNRRARRGVREHLAEAFTMSQFTGRLHAVEHHKAHLYSAFHMSPFDKATAISVDGFGDFSSAAWGHGSGSEFDIEGRVYFPHSLGIFYQAVTQYLGFWNYGDEYKVMGLAPYGRPRFVEAIQKIVKLNSDGSFALDLQYFRHHSEKIAFEWQGGSPTFGQIFTDALPALLGPARGRDDPLEDRHQDIAHSTQVVYEEAFFNLVKCLYEQHGGPAIAIAGGCGMNSVANGKIRRRTPYQKVYVQSAAGDAGGAIGAAFAVWHETLGQTERFQMDHASWGPSFSENEFFNLIEKQRQRLEEAGCTIEHLEEYALCQRVAEAIASGRIIGWFQGRMEWGPRALGNRSILGDPRRADMKDILNAKIKRRESFRPFAPSILREAVSDWFEEDDDVPFMMQVFQICEEKRKQIPAVTHVDGSGRLQTVDEETSPRYYRLIKAFNGMTGVPMLLNTSFNENEPVVCRPEEALECFLRTKMDFLVLGDTLIERRKHSSF